MAKKTCIKCGRQKEDINFYSYKDGSKMEMCKQCMTMHIDNFNPETYLWAIEKADVPYIPAEWNVLRDKAYAKHNGKLNGMSVYGKYLSKMKLKQWKDYGWADSEALQKQSEEKAALREEAMKAQEEIARQQFQRGEISEAQYRTLTSVNEQRKNEKGTPPPDVVGEDNSFREDKFINADDLPDPAADLTQENKIYLALKWGRLYTPAQWVALEKNYKQMRKSFDIQDADSENTLILICKTNLKQNEAIDMGDYQGYQKLSRVSDTLRKSAKFTAAQNKQEKAQFVDSVGQLVTYCEKSKGAIPRFKIDTPQDKVDKVIKDLKDYYKSLIYEDSALARQIEDYLKKREQADQKRRDKEEAIKKGLDYVQLDDQDFADFHQTLEEERQIDKERLEGENG